MGPFYERLSSMAMHPMGFTFLGTDAGYGDWAQVTLTGIGWGLVMVLFISLGGGLHGCWH